MTEPVAHRSWVEFTSEGNYVVCTCGYTGPTEERPKATKRAVQHAKENNRG